MSKANERRKQIHEYTYGEANRELKELRLKLFNLRLQQQRGEVKNNRIFAQTRKDIARLLHRLTELETENDTAE
ncbi:MAG TPA: 50S ribosomal protein L29 [Ktedonobacteraceae bacterium]|nr:50S ribosomal protein L29 [Ktedonobacteraceae bacterium]